MRRTLSLTLSQPYARTHATMRRHARSPLSLDAHACLSLVCVRHCLLCCSFLPAAFEVVAFIRVFCCKVVAY